MKKFSGTQLWVMQTKLSQEDSTTHLVEAFHKLGINWAAFPIIPFSNSIPDFDWDGPRVYYGSTNLITKVYENPEIRAKARLFYDHERHSTSWYGPRLGESWLNHKSWRSTVGESLANPDLPDEFFCRPDSSLKSFSGALFTRYDFSLLMQRSIEFDAVTPETPIIINEPQEIIREYRTWIVGDKVSAVVGYKNHNKVKPWDVSDLERDEIGEFAKAEGAKLKELEAFVLDVGVTPSGKRVVEVNDVHAAGFYRTEHIFDLVADLYFYIKETSQ